MNRFAAVLVILLSLSGCKDGGILDYWERNGIAYDDIRAAQRRFAVFAEQAAAEGLSLDDILAGKVCWHGDGVHYNSSNDEIALDGLGIQDAV